MNDKQRITTRLLSIVFASLLFGCAASLEQKPSVYKKPSEEPSKLIAASPAIDLPILQDKAAMDYLGVSGTGNFNLTEIKTQILIIEGFSMYCPLCQKEANRINELFSIIENNSALNDNIKIIGIGASNTAYEVELFKKKFNIPFPLFSDKYSEVSKILGIIETPTFIGIKINSDGSYQNLYFKTISIGDIPNFLKQILTLSGLEQKE